MSLLNSLISCVRLDSDDGDWLLVRTGPSQGCSMSPSLFNVYMDALMRKVTEGTVGGVMIGPEHVSDLDFANNVALLADSWLVMKTEEVSQSLQINISARKCELL